MMDHIRALRKEITWFMLALAFSGLLAGLSAYYVQAAQAQKQAASAALNQVRTKYNLAKDRKQLIEEFGRRYEQLAERGIVGEEDRLNWVDLIENIAQTEGIPYVKYRIDMQERIKDAGLARKYPGITIDRSVMTLEMQLLHEADLYTLINTLAEKARGLFDVTECNFKRLNNNQVSILQQPTNRNFNVSCTLNWYTLNQGGG